MSRIWSLFGAAARPANNHQQSTSIHNETAEASSSNASDPNASDRIHDEDARPSPQQIEGTLDSIGRRNESLRVKIDTIEVSFWNINSIRTQFHDALTDIDDVLRDLEGTKVAHLEAERKLESLTRANMGLKEAIAALTVEREVLLVVQEELSGRVTDLERFVAAAESASSEAQAALDERTSQLARVEHELEGNRRAMQTVNDQLPAIRTEIQSKTNCLREAERERATLKDQCELLNQENAALRTQNEQLVVEVSDLNRQLSESDDQRNALNRRLEEMEASLGQETSSRAELKAIHIDAVEAHRLSLADLKEQLAGATTRMECAERLLAEARAENQEHTAAIRELEQRALESSLAAKSKNSEFAELENVLNSERAAHVEVEVARNALAESSAVLAKSLEDKEVILRRAEQKLETLEARVAELKKTAATERATFDEMIAKLKEQLEGESAARALAEGALRSARQERDERRQEAEMSASLEQTPRKVSRLLAPALASPRLVIGPPVELLGRPRKK